MIRYPDRLPIAQMMDKRVTRDTSYTVTQPLAAPPIYTLLNAKNSKIIATIKFIFGTDDDLFFVLWLRNVLDDGYGWFTMPINIYGTVEDRVMHFVEPPIQQSIDGNVVEWSARVAING